MYIARHLEKEIVAASAFYPVVMLCGQRQVGKSTLLYHLKDERRRYVTLDDRTARRLAETDPALFFEAYGENLLIDECQRVPELLLEMKKIVDAKALRGEDNRGMFWLTGSQKFKLMQNASESLAGRIAIFDLSSLSGAEIEARPAEAFHPDVASLRRRAQNAQPKNLQQIFARIFQGGMPQLVTTGVERETFFRNYVNTYLERDIKDLAQVGKLNAFYDFLVFMAARTAQELHYEEIARAIGISAPTAKAWVGILERSGIIYILRAYSANITKRLVKTPKFYFMDTGLAAYLCRWPSAETLASGAMDGAFFETYAVTEIIKSFYNAGKQPNLYYYRDLERREVDLLLLEGDKLYPMEIKKAKEPAHADKNFAVLEKLGLDVQPGLVICLYDEILPYSRNAYYCPVSIL